MYIVATGLDTGRDRAIVRAVGDITKADTDLGRVTANIATGLTAQRTIHFDLQDAHQVHAWLRAVTGAFGRSIIGSGLTLAPHPRFGILADKEEGELLWDFYTTIEGREFRNLSDFWGFSAKLYRTAGQFRLFGQAAWELRRNGFDEVISFDVIPGFVYPNVDENGDFLDPPFKQYLSFTTMTPLELDPNDIVIFYNPDFGARPFASDFEALAEYTLPTDINLITAMRGMLANWRTPLALYILHQYATQDDVDAFSTQLDKLYKGASAFGGSAITVKGFSDLKTVTPPMADLPFVAGHAQMLDEIEGVSGVAGAKLGRTSETNRANFRELRRDYWETTLEPIGKLLTEQMYILIHQRIFGISEWIPQFMPPDFLTQVEKATVGMRGRQWGALSTNDLRRYVFNYDKIDQEWADSDYLLPLNMIPAGGSNASDDEEPVDEPDTDSEPPIRGDTDNTEELRGIAQELRAYSRFFMKRWGKQPQRTFESQHIPAPLRAMLDTELVGCKTKNEAKLMFDAVLRGLLA